MENTNARITTTRYCGRGTKLMDTSQFFIRAFVKIRGRLDRVYSEIIDGSISQLLEEDVS